VNRFLVSVLALGLVAACQPDTKNIEKKLDDQAKEIREIKAMIAKGGGGGAGAANARGQQQAREEADPNAVFAVDISQNLKFGMLEGPPQAFVTIIDAWDDACPYCARVVPTLEQLVKDYGGKVRVIYKNLVVHPQQVQRAHLAGCAAGLQGKFVQYQTAWWEKAYKPYQESRDPSKLTEEAIMSWVPSIGLDPKKLKADMDGQDCQALITNDATELRKFRVGSTPSFFINGHYSAGAMDVGSFKQIIDRELKIAEGSGIPAAEYYDKVIMGKGEKAFKAAGGK
jgi:protein-disulfide isomerase